jgi:hypothetical protein
MKKLSKLVYVGAACLVLGASGIAQAADNCENGVIANKTVNNITVLEGKICVIYQVTVNRDITSGANSAVVIQDSFIGRNITADNALSVAIMDTTVSEGAITVTGSDTVAIINNEMYRGNLVVTGNRLVDVRRNRAQSIICKANNRTDARLNHADDGVDACPNNIN